MDAEMKSACVKAAVKLAVGLSLVAAVIGIRVVTATPKGVEAEIAKLERVEAEVGVVKAPAVAPRPASAEAAGPASMASRLGAGLSQSLGGSDARDGDAEKLVSCRVRGRSQFMRAADCAARGGAATVFEDER